MLYGKNKGVGHGWAGTAPDEIHRRPDLYREYTATLAEALADRQGLTGEARAGALKEAAEATDSFMTNVVDKSVDEATKKRRMHGPNPRTARLNNLKASKLTVDNARTFAMEQPDASVNNLSQPESNDIDHGGRFFQRFSENIDS